MPHPVIAAPPARDPTGRAPRLRGSGPPARRGGAPGVGARAILLGTVLIGAAGAACREPAPPPKKPKRTAVEQRLTPAPSVNVVKAALAVRAEEADPQRPWVFRWPLSNIDVTSPYGIRLHPVVRRLLFHAGVDFQAPRGEPVLAAGPGEVAQAGWLPLTGLTVTLHHPGELATLYAHLDELLVFEGQLVAAGAPVGLIGSTGRSTGPHLHFSAYRLRGATRHPLDPAELVGTVVDPRQPPSTPLPPPTPPRPTAGGMAAPAGRPAAGPRGGS